MITEKEVKKFGKKKKPKENINNVVMKKVFIEIGRLIHSQFEEALEEVCRQKYKDLKKITKGRLLENVRR